MILLVTVDNKEVFDLPAFSELKKKFDWVEVVPTTLILKTKDEMVNHATLRNDIMNIVSVSEISESKVFVLVLPKDNEAAWNNLSSFKREQFLRILHES